MPPKLFIRFFRWYAHPKLKDSIEGDLIEEYNERLHSRGKRAADFRFAIDVVLLFRPAILRRFRFNQDPIPYGMYKSYFMIAWRAFLKSKGYSFINITGLAVGLSACLLIGLYVHHELSYDRFHEKAARIFRVNTEIKFGDNHIDLALANPLFGETAKAELPEIEETTRIQWYGSFLVKKGNENIREGNVAWADSTLFGVFTLPMIYGNPRTALAEPNCIVITESVARKYFGKPDVLGETLTINNTQSRKITGVIRDIPSNSHFQFTSFIPLIENEYASDPTWAGSQNWPTYLLLREGANADDVESLLNEMLGRHLGPQLKSIIGKTLDEFTRDGNFFKTSLTALPDIHLHSKRIGELFSAGNIQYVYMFSAIAIAILLIAIINFMNLATARSAHRAREVGMRKVMGSRKGLLIAQFITESFLTCAGAMVLAVVIAIIALPHFNVLTGKSLPADILLNPRVVVSLLILTVIVGILSGSYPAFYLSGFQPASVLKGTHSGSARKSLFRNVLVVFQFAASVILIAGTLIVFRQMKYIQQKDVGYNRDRLLIINNTDQIGKTRAQTLKTSLLTISGVEKATITGFLPVNYYRNNDSFFSSPSLELKDAISMQKWVVDEDYLETMGMRIVEGRNFSRIVAADTAAIILNESAAKFLGNRDILEKKLYRIVDEQTKALEAFHVIGIVKDFNFSSLRETVKPLAFMYGSDEGGMTLKIAGSDIAGVLSAIEKQWKSVAPELPFEYGFMDQDFDKLYKGERQSGKLITYFATLSILISCLGLFGLATYMAEQRTKEIGIRKVMGASIPGITTLLSKDFLRLVLIAVAIATPVAYYFASQWLAGFAYHIDVEWWVFAVASVMAAVIAFMTVSIQAVKAALQNPVKSLRTE